ncbi:MAG: hypothetical protein EXR93_09030 [Gemmatimonadetes bacterium]|nr:hypothetical protein [Gemmatimonadota bacterium]
MTTVRVTLAENAIALGKTTSATASVFDQAGSVMQGQRVTWTSTNPVVASVDSMGKVSALSLGETQVTATVAAITGQSTISTKPDPVTATKLRAMAIGCSVRERDAHRHCNVLSRCYFHRFQTSSAVASQRVAWWVVSDVSHNHTVTCSWSVKVGWSLTKKGGDITVIVPRPPMSFKARSRRFPCATRLSARSGWPRTR